MAGFNFSRNEIDLIHEVRELSATKIAGRATYLDEIGDEVQDWVIPELLARHNLLAPGLPSEYGGRGLNMMLHAAVVEELSAGCAGAAAITVANNYAVNPVLIAGSKQLKEKFLPQLTMHYPHLACTAINETRADYDLDRPEIYSEDLTRISTTACRNGDRIIINGCKDYIINGASPAFIVVLARSKESMQKSRLQFYLVPGDTPGIEVVEILRKAGMRSCHTVSLKFNNVEIPEEYSVGRQGGGYLLLMQDFDRNRTLLGAIGVGIARAAFKLALDAARNNSMLGRSSPTQNYVSTSLAEMSALIDAARLSVMRAAYYIDTDENYARVSNMAKLYATQVAQQVTSTAVDTIGRLGFLVGHPAEKYMRDAQMLSMIAGSDFLHKQALATQL